MKPRLVALPLTREDYDIMTWGPRGVMTRPIDSLLYWLDRRSDEMDRRDADLMHWAQALRYVHRDLIEAHHPLALPDADGNEIINMGGEHWS